MVVCWADLLYWSCVTVAVRFDFGGLVTRWSGLGVRRIWSEVGSDGLLWWSGFVVQSGCLTEVDGLV